MEFFIDYLLYYFLIIIYLIIIFICFFFKFVLDNNILYILNINLFINIFGCDSLIFFIILYFSWIIIFFCISELIINILYRFFNFSEGEFLLMNCGIPSFPCDLYIYFIIYFLYSE